MHTSEPDEQQWIRQLRSGDARAFERLLDRYERRVFNLALRLLAGDMSEAEDATQDIFLEVHRSLARFRGDSQLDTWIHRIAVNVCLQRRRKRVLPTTEFPDRDLPDPGAGDPFQSAARGELRQVLLVALDHLPAPQRDVVLLHGMQGLTYSEVAETLQCPVGTVKSRLSTGFKRLRELLGAYVSETSPAPRTPAAVIAVEAN
ncbi:MAG: polymerase sigma factor, sigma-70 family [Armatimonadetes bacterium]|jgi:RNA polymerase sigma-70 factor (ECF subfamily)|nr:polymerase sigma factor, sigma-70 family [Armatimonadota bacterium]